MGSCTIAEAELQKNIKPVDCHPYGTHPRVQEMIEKCVESMESVCMIEKKPSEWGPPVCIVAKADRSPRFCVDYRTIINKFLVRETCTVTRPVYSISIIVFINPRRVAKLNDR